jgi:hypothetical protein
MFLSPSPEGLQLARSVRALALGHGLEPLLLPPRPAQFLQAMVSAEVVVIDATLEKKNRALYRSVPFVFSAFDHVLVVGRSYAPLNFVARRTGGTAPYPYPETTLANGSPIPRLAPLAWRTSPLVDWTNDPVEEWIEHGMVQDRAGGVWGNDQILQWLRRQIPEILADAGPRLGILERERLLLSGDLSVLRPIFEHVSGKPPHERTAAFLSHRGGQFRDALRLGQKIRQGFGGSPKTPILIKPGALALRNEMLTELRRWMIMALLEDELRRSDELWIVESTDPDKPYRGSWWTTAELYAAAHIADKPSNDLRIRVWNPETDQVREDDTGEYRQHLWATHRDRMTHILSHARPDELMPGRRTSMRMIRWAYRLGLGWFVNRGMAPLWKTALYVLKAVLPELSRRTADMPALIQKDWMRKRANDRVFSDTFWDDLYIEPQRLEGRGEEYRPSPEDFIDSPETDMIRIRASEAAAAVARGRPAIGNIGKTEYEVSLTTAPDRYFWRHARVHIAGGLIPIPTYLVSGDLKRRN